jgi:hypothetical protein
VLDPTDGTLSLRRITVELRPQEQGLSMSAAVPGLGATSISLPGMGGGGRLSASPSKASGHGKLASGRAGGVSQVVELPIEVTGRESVLATWNLQRRADWGVIRRVLDEPGALIRGGRQQRLVKAE